jgi:ACS family allantoate permease-like MFS transporter
VLKQKPGSLKVWQELYIILGCITLAYAVAVFFFLPDKPETTKMLSPRQRAIAIERVRTNKTGLHDKHFKKYQLWEAMMDIRVYLIFCLICASNIANGISSNFSSAIIKGLGYDKEKTALIGMSTGAAEIVAILLGVLIARLTKTRVVPGVFSFIVALIGGILLLTITDKVTQVAAYCLIFFFPVASPLVYSWLSSSVGGTTKKIVFNVILQLGYTSGNVIGPQLAGVSPQYHQGKLVMCVMFGVCIVLFIAISSVHYLWNKQRNANHEGQDEPELADLADYTDKELRSFRYPY